MAKSENDTKYTIVSKTFIKFIAEELTLSVDDEKVKSGLPYPEELKIIFVF